MVLLVFLFLRTLSKYTGTYILRFVLSKALNQHFRPSIAMAIYQHDFCFLSFRLQLAATDLNFHPHQSHTLATPVSHSTMAWIEIRASDVSFCLHWYQICQLLEKSMREYGSIGSGTEEPPS